MIIVSHIIVIFVNIAMSSWIDPEIKSPDNKKNYKVRSFKRYKNCILYDRKNAIKVYKIDWGGIAWIFKNSLDYCRVACYKEIN